MADQAVRKVLDASSIKVHRVWSHHQTSLDRVDRVSPQRLASLSHRVARGLAVPVRPLQPPLYVRVSLGRPEQVLRLALDTTSGNSWLVDAGSSTALDGGLDGVALYNPHQSVTEKDMALVRGSSMVAMPLTSLVPGSKVIGHIITEDVDIIGDTILQQALLLVEALPSDAAGWQVAGVLGLGLHSIAGPPLLVTWGMARARAWREANSIGNMSAGPVLSLWPDNTEAVNGTAFRLGLDTIEGTAWAPVARWPGWAVEGQVVIGQLDGRRGDAQVAGSQGKRWDAMLLIDTTLPGLGVPDLHFASVVHALLAGEEDKCWWHDEAQAPGLQVQCDCRAAAGMKDIVLEVAAGNLTLGARDLLLIDSEGVCTLRLWPLVEPELAEWNRHLWRLGEPFLQRYAVTMDVPRQRLGFAPPPRWGAVHQVPQPLHLEDFGKTDVPREPPSLGLALLFAAPLTCCGLLFILCVTTVCRRPSRRWCRWSQREWLPVSTRAPGEEDDDEGFAEELKFWPH